MGNPRSLTSVLAMVVGMVVFLMTATAGPQHHCFGSSNQTARAALTRQLRHVDEWSRLIT